MAVNNFALMRGLYIPDANFSWPIEDAWEKTGLTAGEVDAFGVRPEGGYKAAATYGTGRNLVIALAALPTAAWDHYIESTFSPSEIGAGPWSTTRQLRIWVGLIYRTAGVTTGTRSLVQATLVACDADGTERDTLVVDLGIIAAVSDYTLVTGTAYDSAMTATVRKYKLRLAFRQPDGGGGAGYMVVDWVGVGIPSASDGSDDFTSWYGSAASHGSGTETKWSDGKYAEMPHVLVKHRGAHAQDLSLQFPYLSAADKQLLQACYMWNRGTPTDDIEVQGATYHTDRGTSQPVILAIDRAEGTRAFYADFVGRPTFLQATGAGVAPYWPESGAIWSASVTFRERL